MSLYALPLLCGLRVMQRMHPYQEKAQCYGRRTCGKGYENGKLVEI